MAVTGVFNADFSNFDKAVQQSEAKLRLLESAGTQVEGSLSNMGKEIPAGIKKIGDETEKTEKATTSWFGSLSNVVKGYLSLQGLQMAWGFAKEIMADADALANLSAQTQIGVVDLQNLGHAMEGFGVSMEETGRGIFQLSKRIGKGDDSVNDALLQMGLSIEKVKGLSPDEMFLTIADAAGSMNEEFKEAALTALFGDKIAQAMVGASAGIREARDAQKELNTAMGPEAVKALADAQREIELFQTTVKNWAAVNVIAPLIASMREYYEVAKQHGPISTAFANAFDAVELALGGAGGRMKELRAETASLNPVVLDSSFLIDGLAISYAGVAKKIDDTTGATKKLREEWENRFDPAKTLAGFEAATKVAAAEQVITNEQIAKEKELADVKLNAHVSKLQAGEAWMAAVNKFAKVDRENAEFEKQVATDQKAIDEDTIARVNEMGDTHAAAGAQAERATAGTVAGYQAVQQQVEITSDGVKGWLELMRATNAANSLLNQNSLFTSSSTLENQARIGGAFSPIPGFASGVSNFEGGLARVHGGEVLANLAPGTSVFPRGQGLGSTVNNTFNLVDSESNLAKRVAEMIMRQIRAGTQLGQA